MNWMFLQNNGYKSCILIIHGYSAATYGGQIYCTYVNRLNFQCLETAILNKEILT